MTRSELVDRLHSRVATLTHEDAKSANLLSKSRKGEGSSGLPTQSEKPELLPWHGWHATYLPEIRQTIATTNAIESMNMSLTVKPMRPLVASVSYLREEAAKSSCGMGGDAGRGLTPGLWGSPFGGTLYQEVMKCVRPLLA